MIYIRIYTHLIPDHEHDGAFVKLLGLLSAIDLGMVRIRTEIRCDLIGIHDALCIGRAIRMRNAVLQLLMHGLAGAHGYGRVRWPRQCVRRVHLSPNRSDKDQER